MSDHALDPRSDDIAALARLHGRIFREAWSADALKQMLEADGTFGFARGTGPMASGFIVARVVADEAEILTLAVASECRRQGVGRDLVWAAAARARELGARILFLEVDAANSAAIALYESLGFACVGLRRGYYRGPSGQMVDGLTMRAALPLAAIGKLREPG